jgi:hypothetical protein
MTIRGWVALTSLVLLVGAGACGSSSSAIDAGVPPDADSCEASDTEHEEILNAPTSATVIRKTPAHPPVGDAGLP